MGVGKSTIGESLAKQLHLPFYDLDQIIEKQEQQSINDIFKTKNQLYFRKLEQSVLETFLNQHDHYILSLGGGTICYGNALKLIKQEGILSIYLKASIETLVKRLSINQKSRPLIKNLPLEQLPEFIAKHLFERQTYYHQCHHTITTDALNKETICNQIIKLKTIKRPL